MSSTAPWRPVYKRGRSTSPTSELRELPTQKLLKVVAKLQGLLYRVLWQGHPGLSRLCIIVHTGRVRRDLQRLGYPRDPPIVVKVYGRVGVAVTVIVCPPRSQCWNLSCQNLSMASCADNARSNELSGVLVLGIVCRKNSSLLSKMALWVKNFKK